MIYVPDLENYQCYVVINSETIRAYKTKPYNPGYNQTINIQYRDYYLNSNYIYQDGTQQFNNYSTIPVCLDKENLTSEYFYRNDLDSILICIAILFFFLFYFPIWVMSRMFKRFL